MSPSNAGAGVGRTAIYIVGIFLIGQPPWTKEGQLDLLGVAVLLLILYIVFRGKRRQP